MNCERAAGQAGDPDFAGRSSAATATLSVAYRSGTNHHASNPMAVKPKPSAAPTAAAAQSSQQPSEKRRQGVPNAEEFRGSPEWRDPTVFRMASLEERRENPAWFHEQLLSATPTPS